MKTILVQIVGYIIKNWIFRFPSDWKDSEQVRLFILRYGAMLRLLAQCTVTDKDDKVVDYAIALANNKMAWDLAYGAINRITDTGNDGGIIPPTPLPDNETDMVRPIRALLARIRNRLSEAGA